MSEKSKFLNISLPAELLEQVGNRWALNQAWLCCDTDLNLRGEYERAFLAVLPQQLLILSKAEAGQEVIRLELKREEIEDIRTRQGIGGGFLDARVNGMYIEVLAFSNTKADTFQKAAIKLREWIKGESPRVDQTDDHTPNRCPKCGIPLEFQGDLCRRCINRGAVLWRSFKMMRPYAGKAALMMGLVLITIALSLVPQQLMKFLIDRVLAPEQAGNPVLPGAVAARWMLGLVSALMITHVLMTIIQIFSNRLGSFVGTQVTNNIRTRLFGHLARLGLNYYDRFNVGQIISRVVSDTEQMKGFIFQFTGGFLAQIITVVAVGLVLFSLNWKLTLITLLPAPLVILSAAFFWKRIYPRYYRVWDANSKLHSVLNTILQGIRVVKAFGKEAQEEQRFQKSSAYVRDRFRGVEYITGIFNPAIGLLFQSGGLLVWFVGGKWVLEAQLTLGELMAFLGYLWMFYVPLGALTTLTSWLTQFITATQRIFELLDLQPQIVEAENPQELPEGGGEIVFENVTFGYNPNERVLRNFNLTIRPGEHIGIVGKSGSGKTTLINLLTRFYELDEGRILINGVDIKQLRLDELRRYVAVVLQDPFLFRGTIYSNIIYGQPQAHPEAVLAAAKAANTHDFIIRKPLGYDTYIGEAGAGLSGGEKQRISLARALLYNPGILILDEATSSIDAESEQLIQEALERLTRGRSLIAIAHRLSTLKNCDRIIVIDQGRIIEQGSHSELIAQGGMYARMVHIQTAFAKNRSIEELVEN